MEHKPQRDERGQPVGWPVEGWSPRPRPPITAMAGRFATVEPLDPDRHAAELFDANSEDREGRLWTYYNFGPFPTISEYRAWLDVARASPDRLYHAIRDNAQGQAVGVAVYQNWVPARARSRSAASCSARGATCGDRGDVSDDAPGVRRTRLPTL
jgi:hypothetical protein